MLNSSYPKGWSTIPMQKLALYATMASILLTLSATEGLAKHQKSENTNARPANVAKQPEQKAETVKEVASKPSETAPIKESPASPVEAAPSGNLSLSPIAPSQPRTSYGVSPTKSGGFIGERRSEDAVRKYFAR
jgi:hypothetical protein